MGAVEATCLWDRHSSRRTQVGEWAGGKPTPAVTEPAFWLFLRQWLLSHVTHTLGPR